MPPIYYELSELFFVMSPKVRHYGIARTVMEVGYALSQISQDVHFVIFSSAHDSFFEVTPDLGTASANGVLDLGLPPGTRPKRLRRSIAHAPAFAHPAHRIRRWLNLLRWRRIPAGSARKVNLDGAVLITLSQPRLISDYLWSLKRQGQSPILLPLLHDMMPLHEAKKRSYNSYFLLDNKYIMENSHAVLANSRFTAGEIAHFSAIGMLPKAAQIHAIQLAHELHAPQAEAPTNTALYSDYLLCVGTLPGRKNLECVLDALVLLQKQQGSVPNIVLAGAHRKRIHALVTEGNYAVIKHRVFFATDPSQGELQVLYQQARGVILPSFIEGWGLPAAEALWLGTPALVADTPVMQEMAGDLGLYFDPNSAEDLARKMQALFEDETAYQALRARIRASQPNLRSWLDVARDLLEVARQP